MAQELSKTTSKLTLNLTATQKVALAEKASEKGYESITQFVAAIAEGRLKYIDTELQEVLSILKQHGYTTGDPK